MTEPKKPTDHRELLRESLAAIDRLKGRLATAERALREPIAIVGLGCRYPGADSPEAFWELLDSGRDAVREIPADRWDVDAMFDPDPSGGKSITNRGGFLDRVDGFDPGFFGISPREALTLDPQQRLLLEVAWETLEHAGIAPDSLGASQTGVYVGITTTDYAHRIQLGTATDSDVYAATGNALNAAAGRVAFVLGLQGPCLAIDTACSSSLVAVHQACQGLRSGECDLALAAGVNVLLSPASFVLFSKWGMLAPDGKCKTFDAAADGMVRAEGCGMVALKRLRDAEAAGDRILAVIRGSAVNHDGRSSGLTVPNGIAQQAVIRRALSAAGVEPAQVDYIEAHGTGTPLGDPIEAEALGEVLAKGRTPGQRVLVGSVKTNIGHTEAASGIAGLIKVVLALQADRIPAQLHFQTPSPRIPWESLGLEVAAKPTAWPRSSRPRVAGISSFGFSGTNAHVVIGEAPAGGHRATTETSSRPAHLLTISARTPSALEELAGRYSAVLGAGEASLSEIVHSTAVGRARLPERLSIVAATTEEARRELDAWLADQPTAVRAGRAEPGAAPMTAWLFTGQGSQYVGMGKELYATESHFRETIDRCGEILAPHRAERLQDVLFGAATVPPSLLDATGWTQPALFAVEYALAELLRSWGLMPNAVVGHSVGEYVAATVAGVFRLEDALPLVAARGALMQSLPPGGAMAAVGMSEVELEAIPEFPGSGLTIAAVNGPQSVVVSGPMAAVAALSSRLSALGRRVSPLTVSHAFHSSLMDPILDSYRRVLERVEMSEPYLPMATNLTGRLAAADDLRKPEYWVSQLRQSVRFADGMRALAELGCETFIEVGPHPVLLGMGRETLPDPRLTWLPLLRRGKEEWRTVLQATAEVASRSDALDGAAFVRGSGHRPVTIPRTRFERSRHWVEPKPPALAVPGAIDTGHPILGNRLAGPPERLEFLGAISATQPAFLGDHVVADAIVFPATGYVELALAAARAAGVTGTVAVENLEVSEPLVLDETSSLIRLSLESPAEGAGSFRVVSSASADVGAAWRQHATGAVRKIATFETNSASPAATIRSAPLSEIDVAEYYDSCLRSGLNYGPAFRGLERLQVAANSDALGTIAVASDAGRWQIHPALLDACFHVLGASLLAQRDADAGSRVYLPMGIASVVSIRPAGRRIVCTAHVHPAGTTAGVRVADLRLEDESGELVGLITGLRLREMDQEEAARLLRRNRADDAIRFDIEWRAVDPIPTTAVQRIVVVGSPEGAAGSLAVGLMARGIGAEVIDRADVSKLGAEALADRLRTVAPSWIVYCADRAGTPSSPLEMTDQLVLLTVGQALAHALPTVGLGVVTRGAQSIESTSVSLEQTPLLGLARTIAAERGDAGAFRLDIDPENPRDETESVLAGIGASGVEPELAERGGRFLAPRLVRSSERLAEAVSTRSVITIPERGTLDRLTMVTEARRPPGPGEVEIEIRAAGLNFRDVLNVLGMYPGDPGRLGSECAGVITAVGPGVPMLVPGARVVAFAIDSLASHVTTSAALVVELPEHLSFESAVTVPNAYVTAAMSLTEVGRLQPGQRVLIHAAAGGVGLMAVRLARSLGAEVIGTGGSVEKRELILREGASHAFDSRSTGFAADVMRVTDGRGVDLVVNSLAGEFIAAGMQCVARGGCFVELGKAGIWNAEEAAARAPHVRYEVVDVSRTIADDLPRVRRLLEEGIEAAASNRCPALPHHDFALDSAVDAFRFMAMARHIGKIVLRPSRSIEVRAGVTYLVTGGLRGIGFETAEWLADQGATSLLLVGRGGPLPETQTRVDALRSRGVRVEVAAADVGDSVAVERLWRDVLPSLPALAGIVHAAGIVDDAPLALQTGGHLERVAAPKAGGAWNLHRASMTDSLDFFVLYSSASAIMGAPGQANYTAANAFLDGLAAWRRATGLVATSIGWGVWGDVGMAARVPAAVVRRWAEAGITPLSPTMALGVLPLAIRSRAAVMVAMAMDPDRLSRSGGPGVRALLRATTAVTEPVGRTVAASLIEELESTPGPDRLQSLAGRIRSEIVAVLGLAPQHVPSDHEGLSSLGMDSLMAVELRTRLERLTGRSLPATVAFEHPTVIALATMLLAELKLDVPAQRVASVELPVDDADVARLLNDELDLAGF